MVIKKAMMMAMMRGVYMGHKVKEEEAMDWIVDIVIYLAIIAIIVLKICGVITISWLWLLAPLWIPFAFGLVLAIIFIILYFIEDKIKGE